MLLRDSPRGMRARRSLFPRNIMTIFRPRERTLGLDIGSSVIKLSVIDHCRGAPELVQVGITPLEPQATVEGEVRDPSMIARAIRETMRAAEGRSGRVAIAVGGRDVIIKKIQTERVDDKHAFELIRWEAEQHLPNIDAVELDFEILDPGATTDEMNVLLVAAKRDLVDAKLRLLAEAGVKPHAVDVDTFALHNALEANYPDVANAMIALVNIGHDVTNIIIAKGGASVPILARDLTMGTRRFREDLKRLHGVSAGRAENVIRGRERSPQLDAVLDDCMNELAAGIERAAASLATPQSDPRLRTIFICGGGSRTPGLAETLGKRLRISVERANPLARLNIRDGVLDEFIADDVAPLLMLSIGLALRQPGLRWRA